MQTGDRPGANRPTIGRLHVIISDAIGEVTGSRPRFSRIDLAAAALRGGADLIQYRRKEGRPEEFEEEGREILRLCRDAGVPMIVNDHLELCRRLDADGVHLGLDDMPIDEARRLLAPERVIGGTARTIRQVRSAAADGADYVGFGPVWQTSSKEIAARVRGLERLGRVASEAEIPVVAIGGVDLDRAVSALEAGAAGVAVIGLVAGADDPESVVRELISRIDRVLSRRERRR